MARRHKFGARHRKSGIGGGFLMKGVLGSKIPMKGILALALAVAGGYAYAKYGTQYVPKVLPYQKELESGVLLGIPGIAGSLLAGSTSGTSGTGTIYY